MSLKPENPVVGGTVLRRQAIESPNYVPGTSGWAINQDGSAEFNNLTIRGVFAGTNFVINSAGAFFYSPSEAAGNLVASIASAAGVDQFGNHYLAGAAAYSAALANSMISGAVLWYTGSQAGGWTFQGQLEIDGTGKLIVNFPNVEVASSLTIDTNLTVTGTASINGSGSTAVPVPNATSTNGLANGQIAGTSGAASAGTAHTHGPGSYAVTSGLHSHDTQNHTHVL